MSNITVELQRFRRLCHIAIAFSEVADHSGNPRNILTDMAATTQKLHELALALVQVTKG